MVEGEVLTIPVTGQDVPSTCASGNVWYSRVELPYIFLLLSRDSSRPACPFGTKIVLLLIAC